MWEVVAALVISVVVSVLLAPKQRNVRPNAINDFDVPKCEEGIKIGVLFGTKKIRGNNVLWYGNLSVEEIQQEESKK